MGWLEIFENTAQEFIESVIESNLNTILVVDDDKNMADIISRYLSADNYHVLTANSVEDALKLYYQQRPNIIITDLIMPHHSGLELVAEIRKNDTETEIIFLTGHGDLSSAIAAVKNQASDFLIKPVDRDVLLHSVRRSEQQQKLKKDLKNYTSELENLFRQVQRSRENLESIIQNSPNATITYNLEGVITSWNDEAIRITGYPRNETIGKNLKDIFVFGAPLFDTSSVKNNSQPRHNIIGQILTKNQNMRYISRNANVLRDSNDNIIDVIESFFDITEKTQNDRLLEKRYLQVQTINEIGKRVAGNIAINDLMEFIGLGLYKTFFESALISFYFYDHEKMKVVLRSTCGLSADKVLAKKPVGTEFDIVRENIYKQIVLEKKRVIWNDFVQESPYEDGLMENTKALFAFPIVLGDKVYGTLEIENGEPMTLDEGDLSMLDTVAEYTAICIHRIELTDKITAQNQLLEKQAVKLKNFLKKVESQKEIIENQNKKLIKDLQKAEDFQRSLLPQTIPDHDWISFSASFTPSSQLGGDYYDIFKINDRYIGILIADASGHGVASAMLSAMFKMTFNKYAPSELRPGLLFEKLNQDFCQVLQMGDFFTAFYGIVDLKKKKFTFSNAGHPIPLLYNFSDDSLSELDSEGFLLGVMDNGISYEQKEISLQGRARLFLYTDGLAEAINDDNVQYGEERIRENLVKHVELPAKEYLDTVIEDLKVFTSKSSFEDDLTLLIMDIA